MNKISDKIVRKPLVKAAALKYDGVNSPTLVAKGAGETAQEIISIAEQNEVHIHYDPLLLDVLTRLELGDEIPEELYLAVAKIIAFAYYLQGKHPDKKAGHMLQPNVSLTAPEKQLAELKDTTAPKLSDN
ncbi:MAG: EscU/YscU/HrcU family type III secretion system export apparatus switch protein [Kangiellaceae bacterium]|nr:EscU/YscU/HrcU family type III secretion system export apparatus switch protein [Kangiellaceae bacterium]